ncbi:hypothetical protein Hdeb2414_s0013g00411161 [Helianthus debilis subsp. tardiflorus]
MFTIISFCNICRQFLIRSLVFGIIVFSCLLLFFIIWIYMCG